MPAASAASISARWDVGSLMSARWIIVSSSLKPEVTVTSVISARGSSVLRVVPMIFVALISDRERLSTPMPLALVTVFSPWVSAVSLSLTSTSWVLAPLRAARAQLGELGGLSADGTRRGAGERDGERSCRAGGSGRGSESHCEDLPACGGGWDGRAGHREQAVAAGSQGHHCNSRTRGSDGQAASKARG